MSQKYLLSQILRINKLIDKQIEEDHTWDLFVAY